jgi:hypothetical protein
MPQSGEGFEFESPDRAFVLRPCQSCSNVPAGNKMQNLSCTRLVYFCVSSHLLALASHMGTMAPETATQQIAALPIQVPPKEHFSLNDIILTCIVYRGQAWYAKFRIEGETADQLLARLVKGEEDRGGCTLICKKSRHRENSQDWRLSCCFGDHDKSAQKAAASVGQPLLVRGAEGAGSDAGIPTVRNVQDHDGEDQVNTAVKKERRKKVAAGQSIKIGCKFAFRLRTTDSQSEVLLVRVGVKEHVDANGQLAHPEHKRTNLSNEAKDWVYGKLLSGTPARTIIDGTVFSCTDCSCSCLVANVVAAGG